MMSSMQIIQELALAWEKYIIPSGVPNEKAIVFGGRCNTLGREAFTLCQESGMRITEEELA